MVRLGERLLLDYVRSEPRPLSASAPRRLSLSNRCAHRRSEAPPCQFGVEVRGVQVTVNETELDLVSVGSSM